MKRRVIGTILSLSLSMVMLSGCQAPWDEAKEQSVEEEIITVEVITPTIDSIAVNSEFVGNLEYKEQTDVFSKMSGEVTEVFFEEGDYVNEGDLLFTIDDEAQQMSLKSAQASYKTAKAGTDQQLGAMQMTIDSDINNVLSAQEGISQIEGTYSYYESQYGILEESKNILEENYEDADDDRSDYQHKLDKAKKKRKKIKEAGGDTTAIDAAIAGYKSAIEGYESAMDSLAMNINTYEQNQGSMAFQASNTKYSHEQAKRQLQLAQENLDYYLNVQAPAIQATASATLEQAQVGIDSAKMQLEFTQVTAPVSGYIHTRNVDVHDMAQAGYPAFVITSDGGMNVTFTVPEKVYKVLKEGQDITVVRSDVEYAGKITEIPLELDAMSGLFKITATVSGDVSNLISGTNVEIYTITDRADNVMTIPIDCIYYEGGEGFVYTQKDGVVSKTYVETGLYDSEKIEVISGLDKDASVITTWSSDLRNGLKVNATAASSDANDKSTEETK